MPEDFGWEVLLEVIKTLLSLVLLAAGWLFGQRIVAYWDDRKKRNEMDIAAAQRFYDLYGEFKAITRLWSTFSFHARAGQRGEDRINFPPDDDTVRLELLRRSAAAESGVEALILKLAVERKLEPGQLETLGLFRQAYQRLRETIREDKEFSWFSHTGAYALFNALAAKVAHMISFDGRPKFKLRLRRGGGAAADEKVKEALLNLRKVTGYGPGDFNKHASDAIPVRPKSGGAEGQARPGAGERV
ncbi:MAG TPA: hypothetical protein VN282_03445 [Pyrinomonadaceae bacterium]|nr:hypothetical protein [Pyrinomonadaceae bacterium]